MACLISPAVALGLFGAMCKLGRAVAVGPHYRESRFIRRDSRLIVPGIAVMRRRGPPVTGIEYKWRWPRSPSLEVK